jgi:hypothetical protein
MKVIRVTERFLTGCSLDGSLCYQDPDHLFTGSMNYFIHSISLMALVAHKNAHSANKSSTLLLNVLNLRPLPLFIVSVFERLYGIDERHERYMQDT